MLTANAVAKAIGAPPNRITAIRLVTFFKTSAKFWMNLQMTYELCSADKSLPVRVRKIIEDNRNVRA